MGSIFISGYGQINFASVQTTAGTAPVTTGPYNIVDGSGNTLVTGTGDHIVTGNTL